MNTDIFGYTVSTQDNIRAGETHICGHLRLQAHRFLETWPEVRERRFHWIWSNLCSAEDGTLLRVVFLAVPDWWLNGIVRWPITMKPGIYLCIYRLYQHHPISCRVQSKTHSFGLLVAILLLYWFRSGRYVFFCFASDSDIAWSMWLVIHLKWNSCFKRMSSERDMIIILTRLSHQGSR